jgi:hypothetical protein
VNKKLTVPLLAILACDPEVVTPRELESGCAYEPLIYNDDYDNLPSECAMKAALCVDGLVEYCDLDPLDCYAKWDHCIEWSNICWKKAIQP